MRRRGARAGLRAARALGLFCGDMARPLRDASGATAMLAAIAGLVWAVVQLTAHDYVAAILLIITGLTLARTAVELLRPTVGE